MATITLPIDVNKDYLVSINSSEQGLKEIFKIATAAFLYKNKKIDFRQIN